MKFDRVTKRKPCVICGSPDWCGVSPDGKFAVCMREESPKQAKNGGWVHVLIEDGDEKPRPKPSVKPTPSPVVAQRTAEDLSDVYLAFLQNLVLSNDHKAELQARGLCEVDILMHSYRSMPSPLFASTVCKKLAADFDLRSVPGFYFKNNSWHFVDYFNATGYLIPIRNAEHKIVGLQLRRDDDRQPKYMMISSSDKPRGASSGTPAHFAFLGIPGARSSFGEIIITEGALKANIIAAYTGTPTVGIVGVGCFDDSFPDKLKAAFPNLEKCSIAFDMDAATNPQVRRQRDRLVLTLEKIKMKCRILSWNLAFKGFDDFLVNGRNKQKFAA